MDILILILVAIVITAVTAKLKEYVDEIISWRKGRIKPSLIIALFLGILSGVALEIGLIQTILQVFGTTYAFSSLFSYVDIGFSCIGLSAGSGWFIGIIEKYMGQSKKITDTINKDNK